VTRSILQNAACTLPSQWYGKTSVSDLRYPTTLPGEKSSYRGLIATVATVAKVVAGCRSVSWAGPLTWSPGSPVRHRRSKTRPPAPYGCFSPAGARQKKAAMRARPGLSACRSSKRLSASEPSHGFHHAHPGEATARDAGAAQIIQIRKAAGILVPKGTGAFWCCADCCNAGGESTGTLRQRTARCPISAPPIGAPPDVPTESSSTCTPDGSRAARPPA
jgi:hypothetical protein